MKRRNPKIEKNVSIIVGQILVRPWYELSTDRSIVLKIKRSNVGARIPRPIALITDRGEENGVHTSSRMVALNFQIPLVYQLWIIARSPLCSTVSLRFFVRSSRRCGGAARQRAPAASLQ